jgi:ABC transporter substrate binding protein (PQQ-dependent alcohol dehydrogenase system)
MTPAKIPRRRIAVAAFGAVVGGLGKPAVASDVGQTIRIGYIRSLERHPTLSLLDRAASDAGLAGAQMAISDNNTTGRFLGQAYNMVDMPATPQADPAALLAALTAQGVRLVVTDLPADKVLALAAAGQATGVTVFNVAAPDDELRQQHCRANVVHVAPTRSMLTDALAEYLAVRRWSRWLLVYGSHPNDALLADAYRRSAKRFGARIVEERVFQDSDGSRRSDSGIVLVQQQMPVFTQRAPEYDVLIAADENEVFASDLPYRTWDARPVAGSAGLRPLTWDACSESWGGTQMQDRFRAAFHRWMHPLDMQAWTAVRLIGEAASRTRSSDAGAIMQEMRKPDFAVAAYKGRPLSLRDWDWQLRQPILLSDGRTVVSVSPQPGFLHQTNDLDTLGLDRPETSCRLE